MLVANGSWFFSAFRFIRLSSFEIGFDDDDDTDLLMIFGTPDAALEVVMLVFSVLLLMLLFIVFIMLFITIYLRIGG